MTVRWPMSRIESSAHRRGVAQPARPRIVLAGQVPPPVTGQGVIIEALLEQLRSDETIDAVHWSFSFTREASGMRTFSLRKISSLVGALIALARIRMAGPIDCMVYPSGGPYIVPILRDFVLLPWAMAVSRRVLIHFHSGGQAVTAEAATGWRRAMFMVLRQLYRRATGAIVMTTFNTADPRSLGIEHVLVIPHHVVDAHEPERRSSTDAPLRLLYVGHLSDAKGTPSLVRAFAAISDEHPSSVLELVGECLWSPTSEELDALIDQLGLGHRVERSGVLTGRSKWAAFARADAFVFPSVAPGESFGLVLAEAMMWGLPVLATDWRGNADVLGRPAGGVLISPEGDLAENIRAGLVELLDRRHRWEQWGAENRARFERHFSVQADPTYFGDAIKRFISVHDRDRRAVMARRGPNA